MRDFSPNIKYEINEDISTLFFKNSKFGSFKKDLAKQLKKITLEFSIDPDFNNLDILMELLHFSIRIGFVLPIKFLIIKEFPLNKEKFHQVFTYFKELYQDKVELEELQIKSNNQIKRVKIKIEIPQRTHYVQQAYLRNFSSNPEKWKRKGKNYARIFCYNKIKQKIINIGRTKSESQFGQKIKNVAWEDSFYSLHLEEFMRNTLEKEIPPILRKVIKTPSISYLTDLERLRIMQYVILSWYRTKESREWLKESFEKGTKKVIELTSDYNPYKIPENFEIAIDEIYLRINHEEFILDSINPLAKNNLIQFLEKFSWKLIITRFQNYYITSDQPVILNNSYFEQNLKKNNSKTRRKLDYEEMKAKGAGSYIKMISSKKGRAFAKEGIEIYLPISPNLCLCLWDFKKGIDTLTIDSINKEIVLQSNKFIFSHKKDFTKVDEIIKKHPECIIKKDNRVEVEGIKINLD